MINKYEFFLELIGQIVHTINIIMIVIKSLCILVFYGMNYDIITDNYNQS